MLARFFNFTLQILDALDGVLVVVIGKFCLKYKEPGRASKRPQPLRPGELAAGIRVQNTEISATRHNTIESNQLFGITTFIGQSRFSFYVIRSFACMNYCSRFLLTSLEHSCIILPNSQQDLCCRFLVIIHDNCL